MTPVPRHMPRIMNSIESGQARPASTGRATQPAPGSAISRPTASAPSPIQTRLSKQHLIIGDSLEDMMTAGRSPAWGPREPLTATLPRAVMNLSTLGI